MTTRIVRSRTAIHATCRRVGIAGAIVCLLAACSGNLQLLEEGRSHPGTWNSATGQIEATIDGQRFTGTYSDPPAIGLGIGVGGGSGGWGGGGWSGSGGAVGISTATGGGGGHAVLTSPDGRVIECFFATSFGRGQGECRGADGRRFVLVIGG
jgi:hypothetical protein